MALVRTTLAAAAKASDLTLSVASTATGFPSVGVIQNPQQPMQVDNELMFIVQVPVAGSVLVRTRGADGTQAVAHDIGAPVITSATIADFPTLATGHGVLHPPSFPDQLTYGQTGTIAAILKDTRVFLAAATAQTMTLGAPSLALNGVELLLTNASGQAHVISAASLIDNGAAGSPFSTITFPAQPGSTISLIAQNGLWNVGATNGTFTYA